MGAYWTQFFPPRPSLTETNLPSQKGKVFLVTGGASGVGYELSSILYEAGGKVYIAGRSESNAQKAVETIKLSRPSSQGQLKFLYLDLEDLAGIQASVHAFRSQEKKLDVLWNNAGVGVPPAGTKSKQGHELQLLLPELHAGAKSAAADCVRVVWASSMLVDTLAPKNGLDIAELSSPEATNQEKKYAMTKVGNWFLAAEFGHENASAGIVSIAQNPGNLKTGIWRYSNKWLVWFLNPLLYEARFGAYTALWAGLSPEVTAAHNGDYVIPWGRWHTAPRNDLLACLKTTEEGGNGRAADFRAWCDEKVEEFI
ncbi:MAG: hypothetical protein Q9191_001377 [Dirinaria sp. TL-2023a]